MNNRTRGNSRRGLSRHGRGLYSGEETWVTLKLEVSKGKRLILQDMEHIPFQRCLKATLRPTSLFLSLLLPQLWHTQRMDKSLTLRRPIHMCILLLYVPVVYQNAVPLGYYPYAHPVPAYMPPLQQGQVNNAAQGQAHLPQLTQCEGNYPAQVPGQHHGPRLRRRHRSRVQARGRGNGRGNRGQPNRRLLGRGNNSGVVREDSARQAAQEAQRSSSQAGDAESSSLAALPVPIEQHSDVNSQGIKQEDTEYKSPPVPQYAESDEVKREPVIKQEPQ